MNQPNYARWSVAYLINLIRLKTENSPLVLQFHQGAFGVKRTSNKLARAPVDLTLEQTINADDGNKLTEVSHLTDSFSARQRWALSHSMRTKIISKVLEGVSLSRKDDVSHSLKSDRKKKDRKHLDLIIQTIHDNMNSFSATVDQKELFNISTGKAASSSVIDWDSRELGRVKK
ncbi:unnamed protein product [Psylliodes chrysocephalus]|uniref:Uncharacterized protein n=1 Tax=Psylliodes chrysocephalus TaxID=3402493 RepID=A0A9P0D8A3_9CUCU|nr:unnamed protein product [Psylliodes chrysocephala]